MGKTLALALLSLIVLSAEGCAGRPEGNLIPVTSSVPGASPVEMLVATTRADAIEPPAGVMFSGERGRGLRFADIVVSIPPDSASKAGEVQWPATPPVISSRYAPESLN